MARVRLTVTFFGSRADRHRISALTLSEVVRDLVQDISDVCQSAAQQRRIDPVECRLYTVGQPKASTVTLEFEVESTNGRLIGAASRSYVRGLDQIRQQPGSKRLPANLTLPILERTRRHCGPVDGEYEGIKISVVGPRKLTTAYLDKDLKASLEKQISSVRQAVEKTARAVEHYQVEGLLYAIEDEKYDDPNASVTVKIDTGEHENWICRITREVLPDDLSLHWKKRVRITGTVRQPRRREIEASKITFLGRPKDLMAAVDRFIEENEALWQGEDLTVYMDEIR